MRTGRAYRTTDPLALDLLELLDAVPLGLLLRLQTFHRRQQPLEDLRLRDLDCRDRCLLRFRNRRSRRRRQRNCHRRRHPKSGTNFLLLLLPL